MSCIIVSYWILLYRSHFIISYIIISYRIISCRTSSCFIIVKHDKVSVHKSSNRIVPHYTVSFCIPSHCGMSLYRIVYHHIILYHRIKSYPVILFRLKSYHIAWYRCTVSCRISSFRIELYDTILNRVSVALSHIVPYRIVPYNVSSSCVVYHLIILYVRYHSHNTMLPLFICVSKYIPACVKCWHIRSAALDFSCLYKHWA